MQCASMCSGILVLATSRKAAAKKTAQVNKEEQNSTPAVLRTLKWKEVDRLHVFIANHLLERPETAYI